MKIKFEKLPIVYVDKNGNVTVSKRLRRRHVNEIRGLMLNETVEMEIREDFCNFEKAKQHAEKARAELLKVSEAELYNQKYKDFANTVYWLIQKGLSLDYGPFFITPDETWCEEKFDDSADPLWTTHHLAVHLPSGKVAAIADCGQRHCSLIHRH